MRMVGLDGRQEAGGLQRGGRGDFVCGLRAGVLGGVWMAEVAEVAEVEW